MKAYEIFYYQYLTQCLRSRQALLLSAVLLLLAAGWGAAIWRGQQTDAEIRQQLLAQAKAIARTINPQRIKALSFTAADIDRSAFQRLRGQMRNYAQATGQRGIYSIALRDGAMIFGPESFAADDPLASPPGAVYQRPPAELNEIFQNGQPRTIGPYTDEHGAFITACAPVADSRTGQPLLIIAIDIEASQWRAQVWWARVGPLLFILGLIALLLAGAVLFKRRDRWPEPRRMRWRHLETHLAAVVGLLLTGGVVWLVHNGETHSRQAIFSQIAEARADSLVRKFLNFRDHQLAGLAQFFKNSELVTRVEFQRYAELFVETAVQAYEWIPQVPATARLALETEMRREGFKAFTIFEKDARGASLPAKTRDVYYPVVYIEPLAGNETALVG
ncbi:MAG: CHASE domain-containing protein [Candidatus Competibacteraceae bacterium]|nr:CHASE domain-containing protein [Candidatus Competibacteraceae bacterium]MCP5126128.1 CHASE domain-containing protein [Gammaproteobacteria bacterium]HRX71222.1 CHASE domain-containing protein [Candidatus Competibacteraceae bacterium]